MKAYTPPLVLRKTFVSLKYPNFRLWFYGQVFSLMGTWVQITAQGFLMYELTNSMAYLGYMSLASGLPSMLLMLYGGVFADRFSRRNLLIISQTVMMILAFVLFILIWSNSITPLMLLFLSVLLGIANAFDVPARQAFVFELVSEVDLNNAISLNSMMFNLAAIMGPAIAGIVYAKWGASWCFLINGISFLGIILVLFMLKIGVHVKEKHNKQSLKDELIEGIQYCYKNESIKILIILILFISSAGMSFTALLPAWAKDILKGDATTFGYLNSFRGMGSLLGALLIANLAQNSNRFKLLIIGTLMAPLFLLSFALSKNTFLAMAFMVGLGIGLIIIFNTLNSLLQGLVNDQLRGRVMSVYSVAFFAGMPLGSFLVGIIAEIIGAKITLILSSVICLMVALWFKKRAGQYFK